MLPPRTMITSGLSLDGLPKVYATNVGVTGLGTSIEVVGVTGLLSTLVSECGWLFDE